MSIKILNQNVRGLNDKNKVYMVEKQAKLLNAQIILMQELMLNNNKKVDFSEYTTKQTFRRNNDPGGGTSVSIDTNIINATNNFEIDNLDFKTQYLEATPIVIKHKKISKPLMFASIYISPDSKTFEKKLNELKMNVNKLIYTHEIFLSGDWNAAIPTKKKKVSKSYKLINQWINEEGLKIIKTKKPTRPSSNNKLDYMITNSTLPIEAKIVKLKQQDGTTPISDHNGILYQIQIEKVKSVYQKPELLKIMKIIIKNYLKII